MTGKFVFTGSRWIAVIGLVVVACLVFLTSRFWWPLLDSQLNALITKPAISDSAAHDDHPESHADHAGHAEQESLELSAQAMKSLGLTSEYLRPIEITTYYKTISVPAVIVERPGRSVIQVATPMTGVVTEVTSVPGSAVEPGAPLFRIRLTHEDLVASQSDFVRALGELDVENRELKRLQAGVDSGVIPPRSVLERQYAKEKLEALLGAQREALRLHGLSERQVAGIERDRRLLSELRVSVPTSLKNSDELKLSQSAPVQSASISKLLTTPLTVESLDVQHGQSVEQGGRLCSLADYSRLYIEGRAFELDSDAIGRAAQQGWKVQAFFSDGETLTELPIAFVASEIDEETRTLKFYVDLENRIVRDQTDSEGHRFVSWQFKPGQRLQLLIPVEEWKNQIVLPADAIAQEGAESFVFQQNGTHFDRISVHVVHRAQGTVVIANDGALFPGDIVASRNAHRLQMAVRNKAGGGIDPHAGHSH